MRSHSEVLRVNTSTHLFKGYTIQPRTDVYLNMQEIVLIMVAKNWCPKMLLDNYKETFTRIIYFVMIVFLSFIVGCNIEQ